MPVEGGVAADPSCRSCGSTDLLDVIDLGEHPPAGTFPLAGARDEPAAALRAMVCRRCWLLQLVGDVPPEPAALRLQPTMSTTMAAHADAFVDEVLGRVGHDAAVVEVASHGGHLQPRFAAHGMATLIVDPSEELAEDARRAGGRALAASVAGPTAHGTAAQGSAVVVDHYLLAHLADPNSEMAMIRELIGDAGEAVLEFDHALPILAGGQYDALRHGHFSYLSLTALVALLERHGLRAVEGASHSVYGGAIRVWIAAAAPGMRMGHSVAALLEQEAVAGIQDAALYARFARQADASRKALRAFLEAARAAGRRVAGYGAPSRGNTLLNAAGITASLLPYTADASPGKQGRRMAGSGVPIVAPDRLLADKPDDVLVLTWDIVDEIVAQLPQVHAWGGRFVVPIPSIGFR